MGGKAAEPTSRTELMVAPPAPDEWAAPRAHHSAVHLVAARQKLVRHKAQLVTG